MENISRQIDLSMVAMTKHFYIIALLVCASGLALSQVFPADSPSADEVIARMFARDSVRESMQGGYVGSREYTLDNKRFDKRATMTVAIFGDPDGTKHFQVVSEEGWKGANKHVFHKMLESESDSSIPGIRPKTRIVPENYEFSLVGSEIIAGRPAYVIEATPKRSDRYLFRGRIWVDAEDYALVRVEGQPAKNPSFWIHSVHFVQEYHKTGPFWFPASTTSVTDARIFGPTLVSIRYFDYRAASCSFHPSPNSTPLEAHYVEH